MSLALLIAAVSPTLVTVPPQSRRLQPICHRPSATLIAAPTAAHIHPLVQEPPAQQIIAVLQTTPEGCVVPIVVRAEVGQPRR